MLESLIIRYFRYLDQQGKIVNTLLGLVCSLLLGVLDFLTPMEYSFSFLYLLPISFTTWFAGKRPGLVISIICTAFWSEYRYQGASGAAAWNILSTLGIFCVVAIMLFRIRQLWEAESTLSRTDPLTGVMNLRAFMEIVEYELMRLKREKSPFSIAYIDLDNFKQINDSYGHRKGDELLNEVVRCLASNLRKTDAVARIGGDEFTIFFPATDQKAVKVVTQKVREELKMLSSNTLATTISMGVVTCIDGACNLDEVISIADSLMYEVKKAGKNNVQYAEHTGA
ncbi:GGDEF domain-containing protein [Pelotalea chapellei]|nr:GGDEF domain-containing protein [Pelotalea chapellei]